MTSPPAERGARRRVGIAQLRAEPAGSWIAYAPRAWTGAAAPWTDLASRRLSTLSEPQREDERTLPELDALDLDDLFLLPPVSDDLRSARDEWAAELIESGTPVLLEVQPGEEPQVPAAHVVYDLLRPLLAGDLEQFSLLPAGATVVWPLIPGLTDSPDLWEHGSQVLAEAAVSCLQPLRVDLTPADRRYLAELGDEGTFDALFHGEAPSEQGLCRCAARHGMKIFSRRPETGGTPRRVRNRQLAADLALAGELWLRLDRSVTGGQSLFRAARAAERTSFDLAALTRESNLVVLDWLDPTSVELLGEVVCQGQSSLLQSLLAEYLLNGD